MTSSERPCAHWDITKTYRLSLRDFKIVTWDGKLLKLVETVMKTWGKKSIEYKNNMWISYLLKTDDDFTYIMDVL